MLCPAVVWQKYEEEGGTDHICRPVTGFSVVLPQGVASHTSPFRFIPCGQHCAEQNPIPSFCRAISDLKKFKVLHISVILRIPKPMKCIYIKNGIWVNKFTVTL
jgi:hypothetical protein